MISNSLQSLIQWCDFTFNPFIGCTKVSDGCRFCYAEKEDKRRGWTSAGWGKGAPRRRTAPSTWLLPVRYNSLAPGVKFFAECSNCEKREFRTVPKGRYSHCSECKSFSHTVTRPRVFSGSLCDILDAEVESRWLFDFLTLVRETENLDWLLLSKRVDIFWNRMESCLDLELKDRRDALTHEWISDWIEEREIPSHVIFGTSVENQNWANMRIPVLRMIPASRKFLSIEPMIGPVDLISVFEKIERGLSGREEKIVDWLICGGESGDRGVVRKFDLQWAIDLKEQCSELGIPFFMKQLGANAEFEGDPWFTEHPKGGNIEEFPEVLRRRQFYKN